MKKNEQYKITMVLMTNMSSLIRWEKKDGVDMMVVPCVMMPEGVHNGIYYSAEELSKFPQSWNGEPVMLRHPQDEFTGDPVSANTPSVLSKQQFGTLFNCRFEDGALKGEAWVDPLKLQEIDENLFKRLNEDNPQIEVSIGVFIEEVQEPGEWNGEKFHGVAVNLRPDHLAFLPDERGAASWTDGAGAPRVHALVFNAENKKMTRRVKVPLTNEVSHETIRDELRQQVQSKHGGAQTFTYVHSVFEDDFVFGVESSDGEAKYYRQKYKVDDDEKVELSGDPKEVEVVTEFKPVKNAKCPDDEKNKKNKKKDEKKKKVNKDGDPDEKDDQGVADNKKGGPNMDRKEKVDALIANENCDWSEDDREFLTNAEDAQFEKICKSAEAEEKETPKKNEKEEGKKAASPKKNDEDEDEEEEEEEAPAGNSQKPRKMSDLLDQIDDNDPMKESILEGVEMHKKVRESIIEELKANKSNEYTDEELQKKSLKELKKLAKLAKVEVDYSGRNTNLKTHDENEDKGPGAPPAVNWDEASKKQS